MNRPPLRLKLCGQCVSQRKKRRVPSSQKEFVELARDDYYHHPLYELYGQLGFVDVVVDYEA